ncbi:aminopeptidase [Risungbinella massiliensis]|uniref:aminopeptidase n=1 Tax=Risungbinella massiliensis TaxID=1329796 RepID=UPI0005CBA7DF|nr:aminopeptidase [Risungbinella massiliensis]
MNVFQSKLEKYAETVLKVGVNLQPGQDFLIDAPLETVEFTRVLVKKAYEAGAKYVHVEWQDDKITRSRFEQARDNSFDYYPSWLAGMWERFVENDGAVLSIMAPNPDLTEGISTTLISRATKAMAMKRDSYLQAIRNNKISWCIISAPTKAWSDKVFSDLPENERMVAMWEAILQFNRIEEVSPTIAWADHIHQLKNRIEFLNQKQYRKLYYTAPGTDLTVELPVGHVWLGGNDKNEKGVQFVGNMPTEEVFTMPKRTGVNGTVRSTMPLNISGQLINQFSFTFENGKIVAHEAAEGMEHLSALLNTDEGSRYLGEIALVPHDSPISKLNRVFYNTLIDENASCHLAIGGCYPTNLVNGSKLSDEELISCGGNKSLIHIDFMIGSADLDVDGELHDGTREAILRKGNWVF